VDGVVVEQGRGDADIYKDWIVIKYMKRLEINKPIAVGIVFGVMFWLALNSILLGIMMGILFAVGMKEEEKRKKKVSKKKK